MVYKPLSQSRTSNVWPLAAICCLSLILLLIAGTIILALIPLYLPHKDATAVAVPNDNDTFYLQYSTNADVNDSISGILENTDEIANKLGLGNDAEISKAYTQGTYVRRKRDITNQRKKRQLKLNILIIGRYKISSTCTVGPCQTALRLRVQEQVQKLGNIADFPCGVFSAGVLQSFTISVTLVGFISSNGAQLGFGAVNSLTFVAIQSGAFNDPLTWSGGIVPFGECSVLISSGITVTIARVNLEIPMQICDIYGTLAFGSGSSAFTFNYAVNLIVRSGGSVQFLTSNTNLLIPPLSVVTLYSGGSFSATGVVIQTYTSSGAGSSTTLTTASGPFTCGVLSGGTLLSFNRVTFIVAQSSSFTSGSTYLGGIAPTTDSCTGGCGLYIASGITVTLGSINLAIRIDVCDVYGTFALGSGSSAFTFNYAVNLIVHSGGLIQFLTSNTNLLIPPLSVITVYSGGSFSATGVVIQTYTSAGVGSSTTLTSASGPITCGVLSGGTVLSFNRVTFIVAQSSGFTSGSTYLGGIAPTTDSCTGGCGLYIASGITVTLASINLAVRIDVCDVYGSFALGSGSSAFTFNYAVNLIVHSGGLIQFLTSNTNLLIPSLSVVTLYSGGSFSATGVVIQTYTSAGLGNSTTLTNTSGPFTCGVLSSGTVLSFNRVTFIGTQSGTFTLGSSYLGGIAPTTDSCTGGCGLYIASGITVTLASINLGVRIDACDVYGSFALGSGSSAFTFNYAVNLMVHSGGLIQFLTSNTNLLIPSSSIVTINSGGSFSATGVVIQTYTSAGVGSSTTLTSASGPLTCGILSTGTLVSFNRITFISAQSGTFTSGSSYLGGIAPTADSCTGGCGLYIPSGYTLTTGDLNGVLDIQFDEIDVVSGASFQLGTSSSSAGFQFNYAVQLDAYGTLGFVGTSGAGIYIPTGSAFDFYGGSGFTSQVATYIQVYDSSTGFDIGSSLALSTSFSGPYYVTVSSNGTVSISVTSPGGSNTTTTTPAVTNGLG